MPKLWKWSTSSRKPVFYGTNNYFEKKNNKNQIISLKVACLTFLKKLILKLASSSGVKLTSSSGVSDQQDVILSLDLDTSVLLARHLNMIVSL